MTTPTQQRWLDTVRRIVTAQAKALDADAYLFGSRATGKAGRISDVDVALMARRPLTPAEIERVVSACEDSTIPLTVDVVDLASVSPDFRRRVLSEAIRWTA